MNKLWQMSKAEKYSLESIYRGLNGLGEISRRSELILGVQKWYVRALPFESNSRAIEPIALLDVLNKISIEEPGSLRDEELTDRLFRIIEHSEDAIRRIVKETKSVIKRNHDLLPIHRVREVDQKTIQWISRKPGRNIREKLAGKPYIKAVKREYSIDIMENRLFKAFLRRLEEILYTRQQVLNEKVETRCEDLLVLITRWLRSDAALTIGSWQHSPPTNTLLENRYYRKVLDGWILLNNIAENNASDDQFLEDHLLTIIEWKILAFLHRMGKIRLIQQPLITEYDSLSIEGTLKLEGFIHNPRTKKNQVEVNLEKIDFLREADKLVIGFRTSRIQVQIKDGQFIVFKQNQQEKYDCTFDSLHEITERIVSFLSGETDLERYKHRTPSSKVTSDWCVIDLCSIRPSYCTEASVKENILSYRLMLQYWNHDDQSLQIVDCADAKALQLSEDIRSISMKNLFIQHQNLTSQERSEASMFLLDKLKHTFGDTHLTYLMPDWANEFELKEVRSAINFNFPDSEPLPRSIAALFSWHSSRDFDRSGVRPNDIVVVIDQYEDGLSLTPVQAVLDRKLKKMLPESGGIRWERHPSITISESSVKKQLHRTLKKEGCQDPEKISDIFDWDGLKVESDSLSIKSGEVWFNLSNSLGNNLTSKKLFLPRFESLLEQILSPLGLKKSKVNVFLLSVSGQIKENISSKYDNKIQKLRFRPSLSVGGRVHNEWQNNSGEVALWRDHLPELSMGIVEVSGAHKQFYLVRNEKIAPQRGRAIDIPVPEKFTLPAGQQKYSFPLFQGSGDNRIGFHATLKSPDFPLSEDLNCRLKMTYAYGADNPYELVFIPETTVTGKQIKPVVVQWEEKKVDEDIDPSDLPVPKFPERKTWEDFKQYPNKIGSGKSNLLEQLINYLDIVCAIKENGRSTGIIERWIEKSKTNVFCFVDNALITQSDFEKITNERPEVGTMVSFYKVRSGYNKQGNIQYRARDISLNNEDPKWFYLSGSIRFCLFTIWNQGHSLSEADVPNDYRNDLWHRFENISLLLNDTRFPKSFRDEIFFFLCCLHKDAPKEVSRPLLDMAKDSVEFRKYYRNIAYALGRVELDWQEKLLNCVISWLDSEEVNMSIALEILANALWRSENLIFRLSPKSIKKILMQLYQNIENSRKNVIVKKKMFHVKYLTKNLELLLALIRIRRADDLEIRKLFRLDNEYTNKFITLVNQIIQEVGKHDIIIESRIDIQIEKPDIYQHTPDLLYAISSYLKNDTGANAIRIVGVRDSDD